MPQETRRRNTVSWLERVTTKRTMNRYEAHQAVAAAFGNGIGRALWTFVPGGLLVRHSNPRSLDWPRGFEITDREKEATPTAGSNLHLHGAVLALRTTGDIRRAIDEEDVPEWIERHCERSGLRFIAIRDLAPERDQVIRPRDARPLTWYGYRFSGEFIVLDPDAWIEARSSGWGKARAFGYGMIRTLNP